MEKFRIYVTNHTRGARAGRQVDFDHAVQIGDCETRSAANRAAAALALRLPGDAREEYASILVTDDDGTIVTVYGPEPAPEEHDADNEAAIAAGERRYAASLGQDIRPAEAVR